MSNGDTIRLNGPDSHDFAKPAVPERLRRLQEQGATIPIPVVQAQPVEDNAEFRSNDDMEEEEIDEEGIEDFSDQIDEEFSPDDVANDESFVLHVDEESGHGFAIVSLELPKDHWLYQGVEEPPMPWRMGVSKARRSFEEDLVAAAKYALCVSTQNGKINFDPDAVIQNLIVGLLGYHTSDGTEDGRPVDTVTVK